MANQNTSNTRENFPLDNLTFDVITILYEKSKGLEAYEKYLNDAQGNQEIRKIIEQIMQQDRQAVQQLQQHLGKLISQQSNTAGAGSGSGGDVELSAASSGASNKTGPTS